MGWGKNRNKKIGYKNEISTRKLHYFPEISSSAQPWHHLYILDPFGCQE
jgi:hypothetical protein